MPNNSFTSPQNSETPFKPEYNEFIKEFPGRGSLKIQVSAARDAFPVSDTEVDVSMIYKGKRYTIYSDVTDSSGIVNQIVLPSRPASSSQNPETAGEGDVEYLISAYHPGFDAVVDCPVYIFDRVETILPLALNPSNGNREG